MIGCNRQSRARADTHVHTRYSDNPGEWYLRRIGAQESYVEPLDLYRTAKARGMDFVTISDHDRIDGALEIAHLPDTYLSCESTVFFPEDGAAIHCLVGGFTKEQFEEFDRRRFDIYAFRDYLVEQRIFHSVAHPLYRVNNRLTVDHFEKLALLFHTFEGTNGMHGRRTGEPLPDILRCLTPELIATLANHHGIEPHGATPWMKNFTGGSDDHSGLFIGCAWTETPPAADVDEFLDHLREGRHRMAGERGSGAQLARGFCGIAHAYYRARFQAGGGDAIRDLLRALGGAPPEPRRRGRIADWVRRARIRRLPREDRVIVDELENLARATAANNEETFALASRVTQRIGHACIRRFLGEARRGRLARGLQGLGGLASAVMGGLPFVAAYLTQNKDESFVADVARRFPGAEERILRSPAKAWLTDTLTDVNGVSRTIHTLAEQARIADLPLTVVTAQEDCDEQPFRHRNFRPVESYSLPYYAEQSVSFPPFLEMLGYLDEENFSEVILSTPGPVGLVGLLAARLLGLKTCGIYHTDLPEYVVQLSGEESLRGVVRGYMKWFYGQLDTVFVRSEAYRRQLMGWGLDPSRIVVLKGGVDTSAFHPGQAGEPNRAPSFLYVGRLSREKNLDALAVAFARVKERHPAARLTLVGDGPHREALRKRCPSIDFAGYLRGKELARAYASADIFVFPSRTDTFGNAVLEAHASGLPAVVSDLGGPAEIVGERDSGLLVDSSRPEELAAAMERLFVDAALRESMARRALETARASDWPSVLRRLWSVREAPPAPVRTRRGLIGVA